VISVEQGGRKTQKGRQPVKIFFIKEVISGTQSWETLGGLRVSPPIGDADETFVPQFSCHSLEKTLMLGGIGGRRRRGRQRMRWLDDH